MREHWEKLEVLYITDMMEETAGIMNTWNNIVTCWCWNFGNFWNNSFGKSTSVLFILSAQHTNTLLLTYSQPIYRYRWSHSYSSCSSAGTLSWFWSLLKSFLFGVHLLLRMPYKPVQSLYYDILVIQNPLPIFRSVNVCDNNTELCRRDDGKIARELNNACIPASLHVAVEWNFVPLNGLPCT